MTTMTREAVPAPVRPSTAPVRAMPEPGRIQRCGGRQCPPGTCDHSEDGTIRRSGHDFGRIPVHPHDAGPPADPVQPTLEVGPPGDVFEQEADRVARMVVDSSPEGEVAETVAEHVQISRVQRSGACDEEAHSHPVAAAPHAAVRRSAADGGAVPASREVRAQIAGLRGGGRPLPESVRAYFEPRIGHDFGAVRVHTGTQAAQAARSLHARAFTLGRDVAFAAGQYAPETSAGKRLLAHELTHVVQQGGGGPHVSGVVQRAGDPMAIPPGFRCPTDLSTGAPTGTDLLFPVGGFTITPAHTALLTTFLGTWVAGGGRDDILVHGYASTEGDQGANWTLSCDRAEAVRTELERLGIPAVRISVVAHGESTDFSASRDPNQRAVVTTTGIGIFPIAGGVLTPRDNFAGRSVTRLGVGEVVDLSFFSFPANPAASFGGLEWKLVSGGGALTAVTNVGTATYTAPAAAGRVQLDLTVAAGATAGRVISSHTITIVTPDSVRITAVPGTAPNFSPAGPIPPGTWGAGFLGEVFVGPRDVSFQGVVFGEGTVAAVVTGSFLSAAAGMVHPANTFGPAHGGNATTGTAVSPPRDQISGSFGPIPTTLGLHICGASDFLWAIPWEFSVSGGPRTAFATANHHMTSTLFCNATIEKAGAGPFVRSI